METRQEQVAEGLKMKNLIQYHYKDKHPNVSSQISPNIIEREEKIAERRAQIPRSYIATYDRAVKGKSLRAAVNSFCIACTGYQREEVRLCTAVACPLYAVRPYQDFSQNGREGQVSAQNRKTQPRYS